MNSPELLVLPTSPRSAPVRTAQSGVGPSDAALVVAARAGEMWAKEALFRRYAGMANGLAFRLLASDEADDLVQDSFVRALNQLDRLVQPQAFAAWLKTIIVRGAHHRLRRARLLSRFGLRPRESVDYEAVAATGASPEVAAELRGVYEAVASLPAEARVVLILRRVDGATLPEIAEQTGLSLATVKRRLVSAERALALLLESRPHERTE